MFQQIDFLSLFCCFLIKNGKKDSYSFQNVPKLIREVWLRSLKKMGMEKKREFQLAKKRTIYLPKKKQKKIFFFTLHLVDLKNSFKADYQQHKQINYTPSEPFPKT